MKLTKFLPKLALILWLAALLIFACGSILPVIWPYSDSVTYLVYNEDKQKWDECHPSWPLRLFNSQACQESEQKWGAFEE